MAVTDKYSLVGKSAVVTGAGNGIGRAIALALAQAGAAVACVDVDPNAAEATVAAIAKSGGQALLVLRSISLSRISLHLHQLCQPSINVGWPFNGLGIVAPHFR